MIHTAVIMAGGRGTRMQKADAAATLTPEQASAASAGAKGLMPIERPFLEYVISALADAGISRVVLVTGPEPNAIHDHFTNSVRPKRVTIEFAVQPEPLGTADAVVRAAQVVQEPAFLVLNSDNYYPERAYEALIKNFEIAAEAAVVAFDRDALVERGNIDAGRVRAFAVLDIAKSGMLRGVIEKPDATLEINSTEARWVGMNLWVINAEIVNACKRVPLSKRGEYELPQAFNMAISEGISVRAICMEEPVLDLSRRRDVASVAKHLMSIRPQI